MKSSSLLLALGLGSLLALGCVVTTGGPVDSSPASGPSRATACRSPPELLVKRRAFGIWHSVWKKALLVRRGF